MITIGTNNIAPTNENSRAVTIVLGRSNDLTNGSGILLGANNTVTTTPSTNSYVLGNDNTIIGRSIAIGEITQTATLGIAIGFEAEATGVGSIAIGFKPLAPGDYSISIGPQNGALGESSIAIGDQANAPTIGSTAIGYLANATGNRATSVGYANTAPGSDCLAVGNSNTLLATSLRGIAVGYFNNTSSPGAFNVLVGTQNSGVNASIAIGRSNSADSAAICIGQSNTSALSAVSMGHTNTSSGTNALTFGRLNTASNSDAIAFGGSCTASGNGSTSFGLSNLSSGDFSLTLGYSNTASGSNAVAIGRDSLASGDSAVAIGKDSTSSADGSVAVGLNSIASTKYSTTLGVNTLVSSAGEVTMAPNNSTNRKQGGFVHLAQRTTGNTPTLMYADTIANTGFVIPSNTTYIVRIQIVAWDGSNASSWEASGLIKNVAGTTSLVAAITPVLLAQDAGLATTAVAVAANNTTDTLDITVTGIAATNIEWSSSIWYALAGS